MIRAFTRRPAIRNCLCALLPYLVLFIITLFQHAMGTPFCDDLYFSEFSSNASLADFISIRYHQWSSRVLIESVLYCVYDYGLWIVLNSLLWCLLAYGIARLFGKGDKTAWLAIGLCAALPPSEYNSAGIVSTEVNYIWPICMGFVAFLPVAAKPNRSVLSCVLCTLALLFACNLEQLCPVVLVFYLLITIALFRKGDRFYGYGLLQTALALASLCFALLCPGNAARLASEIKTWFPDFNSLSLFRKLELGFSSTLYHYIMEPNVIYILLTGLLATGALAKNRSALARLCACLPLAIGLAFGALSDALSSLFPGLLSYRDALAHYGTFPLMEDPFSWMPDIILGVSFVMILVDICMEFRGNVKGMVAPVLLLLAGFCARMILAFSPTIWASGTRTFLIMDFCMIGCIMLLYGNRQAADSEHGSLIAGTVIACVSTLAVLSHFTLWQ